MPKNESLRYQRIIHNWRQIDLADQLGVSILTIQRWERGTQQPSAYYRAKLCDLFGQTLQQLGLIEEIPSSEPTPVEAPARTASSVRLWTIPYPRNPHFTGRDAVLSQLTQQFALPEHNQGAPLRRAALTQSQVIKGLGGIGKTQIAIEYAYRSLEEDRYTHILWISAASEESILTSFARLADLLPELHSSHEQDERKLAMLVVRWLEQCNTSWLLLFDNADDITLASPYFPTRGQGSILLTTRAHAVATIASPIDVEQMGLMEGTHFLLHRTHRRHADDEESNEAINVVLALDGFPLALDQAGAYMEETGCRFVDYLQLYQDHRRVLLARRGTQITSYPDSVATTWSLSFQKVEQANPAAAELLHLCAFLAPDRIPEELITGGAAHWPPVLQQAAADLFTFNQLLEELLKFSLVKRLVDDHLFSIHRLVQAVQMESLSPEEQHQWAERLVRAVQTVFPLDPENEVTTWPNCQRYLEQVQACDRLIQQHRLVLPEAAEVLNRAGTYLRTHALYALAEPLYQRALDIWEQQEEPEHPRSAQNLYDLAELYYHQGNYEQAEPLFQQALRIREQQLGPEHPDIAHSLNNLAALYQDQGKYAEAEPLFVRALAISEQGLRASHPDTALFLNNLGLLYYQQKLYIQAEPLYQRALSIWEQQVGPEHPDLAIALNNSGLLYEQQGKYEQAESLYLRALRIREQQLGPEHPLVALSLHNLAALYGKKRKYAQAEPLYRRALHIYEQQQGPEHPRVAISLINLAALSYFQGKHEETKQLCHRALSIYEQQQGPGNPYMATPLHWLALVSAKQGEYEESERLGQQTLLIWKEQLGSEHSYVASALHGLALLSVLQKRESQAGAFFQQALRIREQQLGPEHLETADVLHDYAAFQQTQGHSTDAAVMYQRALTIYVQELGEDHFQVIETRTCLHAMLLTLGRMEEAAELEARQSEPEAAE